jgi:hypothetical protein
MNVMTALNKCLVQDSNGNYALQVTGTSGDTPKLENIMSKLRKSIDTTNNRVRVVSTKGV